MNVESAVALPRRDRRDSRWDAHRAARREELVLATVAAIGRHGRGIGMEDIAAAAGTSKTVVYRHFTDRGELHLAVCARVAEQLLGALREAMAPVEHPRQMLAAAVDTYLAFIEADPELYRFVLDSPADRDPRADRGARTDPIAGLGELVGEQAAQLVAAALRRAGRDTAPARPWGHGLVGLIRAAADHWLRSPAPAPRTELAAQLTELAWAGLSGVVVTTEPEEHR